MSVVVRMLALEVCLLFGVQAAESIPPQEDWTGRFREAQAALDNRQYGHAADLLSDAVANAKTSRQQASSLAAYGIALHWAGRNVEARPALEQAITLSEGATDVDRGLTSDVLGLVDRALGDYRAAERVLRTAIAENKLRGSNNSNRVRLMVSLADLLREQARETEAAGLLSEAATLQGISWEQRAAVMMERAGLARDMHQWDASITIWNELENLDGRAHYDDLEKIVTAGLGETWFAAGNLARAEPLLRRSLQLIKDDPASSPLQLVQALAMLARLYIDEDKLALAEQPLGEAIAKDEAILGAKHPQVATLLELRATVESGRGDVAAAREDLVQARSIMEAHFGGKSVAEAGVLAAMADVESRANQPDAAVPLYAQALQMLRDTAQGDAHPDPALVVRYAAALKAAHHGDEARALLKSFGPAKIGQQSLARN